MEWNRLLIAGVIGVAAAVATSFLVGDGQSIQLRTLPLIFVLPPLVGYALSNSATGWQRAYLTSAVGASLGLSIGFAVVETIAQHLDSPRRDIFVFAFFFVLNVSLVGALLGFGLGVVLGRNRRR